MNDLYDDDIVPWSERQSELLRQHAAVACANDVIEWANITEEIEAVGGSECADLASHIGTVIEHLLKLETFPAIEPRTGWRETVIGARTTIAGRLKDSPSPCAKVDAIITCQLPRQCGSVADLLALYGEVPRVSLEHITYSPDQILGSWLQDPEE